MKVALITGVAGQDGKWLADLLRNKEYKVHGTSRMIHGNSLDISSSNIITLHELQLDKPHAISTLVEQLQPDEIYHLAARSSSAQLADDPLYAAQINGLSALYFLEAVKTFCATSKFCFASSSEVFAGAADSPQSEQTACVPVNPYGISKHCAMQWVSHYRRAHGLFACSAILYNHESIHRGFDYVTRKITSTAASIYLGKTQSLQLGDLDSQRDWMHAKDAVRGMWAMLQSRQADDFVFGSGVLHSVRDVCEIAFSHLGLDYRQYVVSQVDKLRREERFQLKADTSKAANRLSWQPEIPFELMIKEMVDFDVQYYSEQQISLR